MNDATLLRKGIESFQAGEYAEAERIMRKVLKRNSSAPDALHVLGLLAARSGQIAEAERLFHRCVAVAPGYTDAHNNLGNILMARRQFPEAQASYARAAQLAPRYPLPHYSLGNCLRAQGRLSEAEAAYRTAIEVAPDYIDARINLGSVLREQGSYEEAERVYCDVLERRPNLHEMRLNLGNVYRLRGDLKRARTEYEALLRMVPGHGRAQLSLAQLWLAENQLGRARELIEGAQASGSAPVHEVFAALASLYAAEGNPSAALAAVGDAIAAGADSPEYYVRIADLLAEGRQHRQAIEVLERSRSRFGDRPPRLLGLLVDNQRRLCDWRQWPELVPALVERICNASGSVVAPFTALSLPGLTAAHLLAIARAEGKRFQTWIDRGPLSMASRDRAPDGRLRIGYLSGDLREHPTSYLTASVFELHDRQQFEIFAYDIGPPGDSPMRRRLRGAFEHFTVLNGLSHEEAAQCIRDDGIDVLVDTQGYTSHARTEILAQRPAPIQVNWLGFPGSMGVPFIDYLIVDQVVVPPGEACHYHETLAYLPDCYAPVDFRREVGRVPTRAEVGLPEDAFVFCCFNNPYKLTPEIFYGWCDLLREVPNSVLWVYADMEEVREHLTREAVSRGLAAERLVFANKRPQADHLARMAVADLFLDTQPYNAHTTASDALWVGLPVLTYPGQTFPSRVATSLLTAAGLTDLISTDLADYLKRARRLATSPATLAALRSRLAAARDSAPLFDSRRFTREMEKLFQQMWARHHAGLPPAQLGCLTTESEGLKALISPHQ